MAKIGVWDKLIFYKVGFRYFIGNYVLFSGRINKDFQTRYPSFHPNQCPVHPSVISLELRILSNGFRFRFFIVSYLI